MLLRTEASGIEVVWSCKGLAEVARRLQLDVDRRVGIEG